MRHFRLPENYGFSCCIFIWVILRSLEASIPDRTIANITEQEMEFTAHCLSTSFLTFTPLIVSLMTSRKVFISILLVFTYFLGLAHEMIPHAHHNTPGSVGVMPIETGDANHQNCIHFSGSSSENQFADQSVCESHHHPSPCSERTLYLPSLSHNFNTSDDCGDVLVFAFLTNIAHRVIEPEKALFPPDSKVHIYTPGPDEISLRGPPAFSC